MVYEEDPAEARKLLAAPGGMYEPAIQRLDDSVASRMRRRRFFDESASGPPAPAGFQPPVRAVLPSCVKDFDNLTYRGGGGGFNSRDSSEPALVFLGERTTSAGKRYLVE